VRLLFNINLGLQKDENEHLENLRYNHKNKERIKLELEEQNNQIMKNGSQIIDLDNMNQFQFWKSIERLKDFERKEVQFHSSLKNNIAQLHDTVDSGSSHKQISHQDILYFNRKSASENRKQKPKNVDLNPVKTKINHSSSTIRITKKKIKPRRISQSRIKQRMNSESRLKPKKGRNSEMCTTISSFMNKSKKLKNKKRKLPSIKFSFDLDSTIPCVKSPVSKYTLGDINMSNEFSKYSIEPINEEKRMDRLLYKTNTRSTSNVKMPRKSKILLFYNIFRS